MNITKGRQEISLETLFTFIHLNAQVALLNSKALSQHLKRNVLNKCGNQGITAMVTKDMPEKLVSDGNLVDI